MNVEVKKLPKSTVAIKASLDAAEFDVYIQKALGEFVKEAELPGFRKGKAPEQMVAEKVGEARLLEEAARIALDEAHPKILTEHQIDGIGRPQIRLTKLARGNPLEWEVEIAVLPEITLPDYQAIGKEKNAVPKEEVVVSAEEVEKSLEWLRKSRKTGEGEHEVIPELTDEFAKSVGPFETVADLRRTIETNMKLEQEMKARDKHKTSLLEAIADKATLEIPDLLVESEKDKMLHELKESITSMGMSWEDYLTHIKKSEEDLRKEWQEDAARRVRFALVLREIAKKENLSASEEDLDHWTDDYIASQPEETRKKIDRERVKEYAYGVIRNEKVFNFLENL